MPVESDCATTATPAPTRWGANLLLAAILEHLEREPTGLAGLLEVFDAEVEPTAEDARQPRETFADLGFGEPAPDAVDPVVRVVRVQGDHVQGMQHAHGFIEILGGQDDEIVLIELITTVVESEVARHG